MVARGQNRSSKIPPPNLLDNLDKARSVAGRTRLGLLVDFDGTISEIAPTPGEAIVSPGCAEMLRNLSGKLSVVSVVSGRSASDISDKVGLEGILYAGSHGAEYIDSRQHTIEPRAKESRRYLAAVLEHLGKNADGPGIIWDDKELSAAVHYRMAPDTEEARASLESALSSAPGVETLDIFWGKFVLEMRASVGLNKGYVVRKLVREKSLEGLVFIGDDTTDVDGMWAVRDLGEESGIEALGIAVTAHDTPPQLLESAGFSLDGVPQVERFLRWLDSVTG